MTKMTRLAVLLFCFCFPLTLQAAQGDPISLETQILDVPTAETFDRYQASFLTRAYGNGAVMESIDFGVYPRINIGMSLAAHELLGSSDSVRVLDPDFQAKWKIYDGDLYLPAIAIGYDGRRYGYGFNEQREYANTKHYLDDRKGGYLTLSREIIVPGLHATAGLNFSDFDWDELHWFTGAYYTLAEKVSLLAEWDNIRNMRDSRLNLGARFYLHPSLALDGMVRRIGRGDESERVLQIRYVTNF
ncbi:MAG: hypothetical protein MR039_04815 [Elusimicrobia bacterium]|nr:hypothetical protein [Elusimicrobiota bacterium]MDD7502308.1 hypothetical protein [Elusimicrobiota bacterium]MDY5728698.1 hypothetical protein [Elusimicrobiaceae bacterium]